MFVVELVGLPGVGKTTIAQPLAERLSARLGSIVLTADAAFLEASRKRGDGVYRTLLRASPDFLARHIVDAFSKRTRFRFNCLVDFLIKHHALLTHVCAGRVFRSMPQDDRHLVVAGLLSGGSLYQSIQSEEDPARIVVFDEGFVQWSLIVSSLAELDFDVDASVGFIERAPMPNLIVHLTSQIETCVNRMRGRHKGITRRMRRLDEQALRESLRLAAGSLSTVVRILSTHGCPVVQVEAAGTIGETVESIATAVCQVIPSGTSESARASPRHEG